MLYSWIAQYVFRKSELQFIIFQIKVEYRIGILDICYPISGEEV